MWPSLLIFRTSQAPWSRGAVNFIEERFPHASPGEVGFTVTTINILWDCFVADADKPLLVVHH